MPDPYAALPSLAPPAPAQRPRVLLVAATFVSVAVAMLFVGMIGTYLTQRNAVVAGGESWLPDGVNIPLTQPNVMLMGLLMSSITVQWAFSAVRNDDRVNTYLAIGLTILFGVGYLNMAAYLYAQMGLDINAQGPAVLIYAITGAHLVLAVVAMVFLGLMGFRALAGGYSARQYDGIAAAAMFWHVMVALYALAWYAIYVMK